MAWIFLFQLTPTLTNDKRDLLIERTQAGLGQAWQAGKCFGRPILEF